MAVSIDKARLAKGSAKLKLADLPGVVGIGITKIGDDYALKVNLEAPLPAGQRAPQHIDGVPVQVEVVRKIRKQT